MNIFSDTVDGDGTEGGDGEGDKSAETKSTCGCSTKEVDKTTDGMEGKDCAKCGGKGTVDSSGSCTSCGATMVASTDSGTSKSGRVLSKANEDRLSKAAGLLSEVLDQVKKQELDDDIDDSEEKIGDLIPKVAKALLSATKEDTTDAKIICGLLVDFVKSHEAPAKASKLTVREGRLVVVS